MSKPGRAPKIVFLLLFAWAVQAGSGFAQVQYAPTIMKIGLWLGEQFLGYAAGKAFDKLLGLDNEKQLEAIQENLQAQVRKGSKDSQKLRQMRIELETTNSQLAMLRTLMSSRPSAKEMESFRLKLSTDLERLKQAQQQNAERIELHEDRIDRHDLKLEEMERNVVEITARLRRLEGDAFASPDPRNTRDSLPSFDRREREEPAPRVRSSRPVERRGVTLTVMVTGGSNELYVQEVGHPENANVGFFEVKERRDRQVFYLLAGTGGVFSVHGGANRIILPRPLCGRVRIVDRGEQNQVVGCN